VTNDCLLEPLAKLRPTYPEVSSKYVAQEKRIGDPAQLILVDETVRLRMASLEQIRSIFDERHVGLVLIGMPGLENRYARYAQFYSRICFVHHIGTK
jgi:DNA transposition AAA+ family ATPase